MIKALRVHWPEYLMEAVLLGLFMLSASFFTVLFEHPASPVNGWMANPAARRACIGLAMGLTAIALIYSPWGKQSGAHLNPAVTFTFWRLGKVKAHDAIWYGIFQFLGGAGAMLALKALFHPVLAHPSVNYAVTAPGPWGVAVAFMAEAFIAGGLMLVILFMTSDSRRAGKTGFCAGLLVALYITFEAPLSGMSMNPARTVASAMPAGNWTALWIYFLAPVLGMLSAVELFRGLRGLARVSCAKLHHDNPKRCIFCGKKAVAIRRFGRFKAVSLSNGSLGAFPGLLRRSRGEGWRISLDFLERFAVSSLLCLLARKRLKSEPVRLSQCMIRRVRPIRSMLRIFSASREGFSINKMATRRLQ